MIADDFRCFLNWLLIWTMNKLKYFMLRLSYESLKRPESLRQTWEKYEELNTGQTDIVTTWATDGAKIKKFLGQILEFMKEVTSSAHLAWKLPTWIILHQKVSFLQMPTPR